jgi:hypothetical protein
MTEELDMQSMVSARAGERGTVTVVALVMLVVLTLVGIAASRTSSIDIRIAGNEIPFKRNFFLAEGGIGRECIEVGAGSYPVVSIHVRHRLADQTGQTNGNPLPAPTPHQVNGTAYDFELWYEGHYLPPAGYSPLHFSRYDFFARDVRVTGQRVEVDSRFYKIGPKASS